MPDDLREIVTVEQVNHWFVILAIALPILGAAIGAVVGARTGLLRKRAIQGFCIGLFGPVNFALWQVYNRITDAMGLDRVKTLLVNLGLFAAIGIVGGLVAGRFARKPSVETTTTVVENEH